MYIWDNKKFMLQEFWPRKRAHLREQFKKRRFMEMQMKCCGQKQNQKQNIKELIKNEILTLCLRILLSPHKHIPIWDILPHSAKVYFL